MLVVMIRTAIMFFLILIAVRLMGKSELSKLSPFQLVVVFMIAELGAIPLDDPSIPLVNGIASILTLVFLQVLLSIISVKSETFKNIANGSPSILIDKNRINVRELKKLKINLTDFMELLRISGYSSPDKIQFAVLESNGQLSVIEKGQDDITLPLILISDGNIYHHNFKETSIKEPDLLNKMCTQGIYDVKDVFLAVLDEKEKVHLYLSPEDSSPFAKEVII